MSKKYKGETIYNYLPEYLPSTNVESPVFVKLPSDRKDSRLKDLEREIIEYWSLIHPLVREYLLMIIRYLNEFSEGTEDLDHLRRSLDIEMNNSAELSEENRKLKAQISDLVVDKKALQEKVDDLIKQRPEVSSEEVNAMKLMLSSKFDVATDSVDNLLEKAIQNVRESEEIKKAKAEKEKMAKELEEAKKNFEKTQAEVGETFQKRLLEAQNKIEELEDQLKSN